MGLALRVGAVHGIRFAGRRLQFPIGRGSTRREFARPAGLKWRIRAADSCRRGARAVRGHTLSRRNPDEDAAGRVQVRNHFRSRPAAFPGAQTRLLHRRRRPRAGHPRGDSGRVRGPRPQLLGSDRATRRRLVTAGRSGVVACGLSIRIGQCARGRNPQRCRHICLQARRDDACARADRATDGPLLRCRLFHRNCANRNSVGASAACGHRASAAALSSGIAGSLDDTVLGGTGGTILQRPPCEL